MSTTPRSQEDVIADEMFALTMQKKSGGSRFKKLHADLKSLREAKKLTGFELRKKVGGLSKKT